MPPKIDVPATAEAIPAASHDVPETHDVPEILSPAPTAAAPHTVADAEAWLELIAACALKGPSRELAANAAFAGHRDGVLRLVLAPGFEYLRSERSLGDLAAALAPRLGGEPKIVFETGHIPAETLNQRVDRERDSRQGAAETAFMNDPDVRLLIQQHGARLVPDSIRPFDE